MRRGETRKSTAADKSVTSGASSLIQYREEVATKTRRHETYIEFRVFEISWQGVVVPSQPRRATGQSPVALPGPAVAELTGAPLDDATRVLAKMRRSQGAAVIPDGAIR
jgi:hypothetical protein